MSLAERSNRHQIAIVDGNEGHRKEVSEHLTSFYEVSMHVDIRDALTALKASPPALVLVGEKLSQGYGLNFIKAVKQEESLANIPLVYIIDKEVFDITDAAEMAGANSLLIKPYRRSQLIKSISALLNEKVEANWETMPEPERMALKSTVQVFNDLADVISSGEPLPYGIVKNACLPLVESIKKNEFKNILSGVKEHDNYTYAHSMRVATLLSLFGDASGLADEERMTLASGGLLHDVGKMLIPHSILNKPGRLTEVEFSIMKMHVPETVRYLRLNSDVPKAVITIAEQHHEKLDGSGYPYGLKASELNDLARMAAIVDIFSALTDRRVYKAPMPPEQALTIMTNEMTQQLDQHFLKLFGTMLLDAVGSDEKIEHVEHRHDGCC